MTNVGGDYSSSSSYKTQLLKPTKESDILKDQCCICFEHNNRTLFVTECNHSFHELCLHQWIHITENKTCPNCIKTLSDRETKQLSNIFETKLLTEIKPLLQWPCYYRYTFLEDITFSLLDGQAVNQSDFCIIMFRMLTQIFKGITSDLIIYDSASTEVFTVLYEAGIRLKTLDLKLPNVCYNAIKRPCKHTSQILKSVFKLNNGVDYLKLNKAIETAFFKPNAYSKNVLLTLFDLGISLDAKRTDKVIFATLQSPNKYTKDVLKYYWKRLRL